VFFLQIWGYELEGLVNKELRTSLLLLPSVAELLYSMGYQVSFPAVATGKSGVEHRVDLYAQKSGEDVVVQISTESTPMDVTAVVSFFAKVYDIQAKHALMIAFPSASDAAKRVATSYGIKVIEERENAGLVEKMKEALLSPAVK